MHFFPLPPSKPHITLLLLGVREGSVFHISIWKNSCRSTLAAVSSWRWRKFFLSGDLARWNVVSDIKADIEKIWYKEWNLQDCTHSALPAEGMTSCSVHSRRVQTSGEGGRARRKQQLWGQGAHWRHSFWANGAAPHASPWLRACTHFDPQLSCSKPLSFHCTKNVLRVVVFLKLTSVSLCDTYPFSNNPPLPPK